MRNPERLIRCTALAWIASPTAYAQSKTHSIACVAMREDDQARCARIMLGCTPSADRVLSSCPATRPLFGAAMRRPGLGGVAASAPPRRFDLGDVDLFHRHHRVKRTFGRCAIGVGDRG